MNITKDCVVAIEYILTNDEGEVIDSSEGVGPLEYIQGHNDIISGLEKALEGKQAEDKISVVIAPEEGYGPYYDEFVAEVDRDQFDTDTEIEIGMQFEAETESGSRLVTVTKVTEKKVTVDANHPLAGENLHFEVTVVSVRAATEEELKKGLHDECGCGCGHDCDGDCDCEDGCDCDDDCDCESGDSDGCCK